MAAELRWGCKPGVKHMVGGQAHEEASFNGTQSQRQVMNGLKGHAAPHPLTISGRNSEASLCQMAAH